LISITALFEINKKNLRFYYQTIKFIESKSVQACLEYVSLRFLNVL